MMDSRDKPVEAPPVQLDYATEGNSTASAIIGVVLLWTMASCATDCYSMAVGRMGNRTTYSTIDWLIAGRIVLMGIGAVFSARVLLKACSERFGVTIIWWWAVASICLGGVILVVRAAFDLQLWHVFSYAFGIVQFAVPAAVLFFAPDGERGK